MELIFAALLGFFAGSIPFGLILTKAAGLGDVRDIGSGSIGATNVLRTGNKGLALATVLLDAAKGVVPVLIAARLYPGFEGVAGVFAVLGHCYTPWLKFKGGKGFATAAGVCGALAWPVMLLAALIWAAAIAITRTSSIASLTAVSFAPVLAIAAPLVGWPQYGVYFLPLLAIQVIVFIKHNENIKRLLSGKEPKIGGSK
ncbi:MAG: glycerol-3-phosphate 1-O-acyltransferase PlsY [Erythrobacter sp.]